MVTRWIFDRSYITSVSSHYDFYVYSIISLSRFITSTFANVFEGFMKKELNDVDFSESFCCCVFNYM